MRPLPLSLLLLLSLPLLSLSLSLSGDSPFGDDESPLFPPYTNTNYGNKNTQSNINSNNVPGNNSDIDPGNNNGPDERETQRVPVVLIPGIAGSILRARRKDPEIVEDLWLRVTYTNKYIQNYFLGEWNGETHDEYVSHNSADFDIEVPLDDFGLFAIDTLNTKFPMKLEFIEYFHVMIKYLRKHSYIPGLSLFGFPYDWRQSPTSSLSLSPLHRTLREAYIRGGERGVDVISHSYGGLLVWAYMEMYPKEAEKYIRSWVPIGVPFRGSPAVIHAMLAGYAFENPLVSPVLSVLIARSMPTSYWLWPDESVDWGSEPPRLWIQVADTWKAYTVSSYADLLPLLLSHPSATPFSPLSQNASSAAASNASDEGNKYESGDEGARGSEGSNYSTYFNRRLFLYARRWKEKWQKERRREGESPRDGDGEREKEGERERETGGWATIPSHLRVLTTYGSGVPTRYSVRVPVSVPSLQRASSAISGAEHILRPWGDQAVPTVSARHDPYYHTQPDDRSVSYVTGVRRVEFEGVDHVSLMKDRRVLQNIRAFLGFECTLDGFWSHNSNLFYVEHSGNTLQTPVSGSLLQIPLKSLRKGMHSKYRMAFHWVVSGTYDAYTNTIVAKVKMDSEASTVLLRGEVSDDCTRITGDLYVYSTEVTSFRDPPANSSTSSTATGDSANPPSFTTGLTSSDVPLYSNVGIQRIPGSQCNDTHWLGNPIRTSNLSHDGSLWASPSSYVDYFKLPKEILALIQTVHWDAGRVIISAPRWVPDAETVALSCTAGYIHAQVHRCSDNTVLDSVRALCRSCPLGFYVSKGVRGVDRCHPCGYSLTKGARWSSSDRKGCLVRCEPGTRVTYRATGEAQCTPCERGTFSTNWSPAMPVYIPKKDHPETHETICNICENAPKSSYHTLYVYTGEGNRSPRCPYMELDVTRPPTPTSAPTHSKIPSAHPSKLQEKNRENPKKISQSPKVEISPTVSGENVEKKSEKSEKTDESGKRESKEREREEEGERENVSKGAKEGGGEKERERERERWERNLAPSWTVVLFATILGIFIGMMIVYAGFDVFGSCLGEKDGRSKRF